MNENSASSESVRGKLVEALRLDLVGPDNDHPYARELLPESPSRWYLTGFLVPTGAPAEQRGDPTVVDELDSPAEAQGLDDAAEVERSSGNRRGHLPSSLGISVLIPAGTRELGVTISWGDYSEEDTKGDTPKAPADPGQDPPRQAPVPTPPSGLAPAPGGSPPFTWRRVPRTEHLALSLPADCGQPKEEPVPGSQGLYLVVTQRSADTPGLPKGTRALSVFLVNYRVPDLDRPHRSFVFQAGLRLKCREGFVARADLRGTDRDDERDERVADLHYRDCYEYAVGHGVATRAEPVADGTCQVVNTAWVPEGEVERIAPSDIPEVELRMEALATLANVGEARNKLGKLVTRYRDWLDEQGKVRVGLPSERAATAEEMETAARTVAKRIEEGIELLADEQVMTAFRLANRTVATSLRRRFAKDQGITPDAVSAPKWYPFQVAYLLMTMRGIVDPKHDDRQVVDLIFFPTGGGKTEAYLALAAFTLVLRRLRAGGHGKRPGIESAGVCVLMRYTLRLLTLDQLSRAASLICALELERQAKPELLGDWPFEIGLWVGQAATPNRMGHRGDKSGHRPYTAYTKTTQFQGNSHKNPSPIPLEECPWCGSKFDPRSFRLVPNPNKPSDLRVHCGNHCCDFHGDRHLPIVAVDEPIYRRLPCFLIATVDKFASLPWTGETGTLFGRVERFDKEGFYGPCDPGRGLPLPHSCLPPPDLIIQDELHLISGPLGTVAGLYETVIDALSTRTMDSHRIRPKVVASTATVRRADSQIRALFNYSRVSIFPPPGPDRRDSFFARTLRAHEQAARLYLGVAAPGRSLKVVLLRAGLAMLSASQVAWEAAGGAREDNPADPYMTWLGYFNSLRELGGSRRIIDDELRVRLVAYGKRRRLEPTDRLFANRKIQDDVLELTSRVSTSEVASAKRRLAKPYVDRDHVDVALATNMISVGLDITRLGLMTVLGQPKTCAEYIQATSRVGRDARRPGLVVTLLNVHKPRDRSHYERFAAFHQLFYRNVEVTSVTPFSPRALDRALPAVLVALCRQGAKELTPAEQARNILSMRAQLAPFCQILATRASEHHRDMSTAERTELGAKVLHRCDALLDAWLRIARRAQDEGGGLQYQREKPAIPRHLLYDFMAPELPDLAAHERQFRANRSMRDVEASVELTVKPINDWGETS